MSVMSFDFDRRTNADLILDVVELGHIRSTDAVLDATYGYGAWWSKYRPENLTTNDQNPKKGDLHFDFRKLHVEFGVDGFDVVAFDPDYGYRGTSQLASDERYGVDEYLSPDDRDLKIVGGAWSCAQVAGRVLLVKIQNQVVSGRKRWQTIMVADEMRAIGGWRLADELHICSYRAQPPGRRQVHAASNYSTMQIWTKT